MGLTSKNIAKKYNCEVFKDHSFDSGFSYWVAVEKANKNDKLKFEYADGYTLNELVYNIENEIKND